MTDRYAVFGNPVEHSLSPRIHTEFARQTGRDISYQRQRVEPGEFNEAAERFFTAGGKGLNITVPFKIDAFHFASRLTPRAKRAGAVNTLALLGDGAILGDNTDGAGLIRDILVNLEWQIAGKRVLILGAGGAVRGVLEPILNETPKGLVISNRTVAKAQALAREFCDLGEIEGCGFEHLSGKSFDLVINGTSASLAGELPPLPPGLLTETVCCYDMMYAAHPTVFLEWASQQHVIHLADGLGMLVEQAAESFQLWQGIRPLTGGVIEQLRRQLNQC